MNLTPRVNCQYGAPLGRHTSGGIPAGRFYLKRIPLDSGGYDPGGAYWGLGMPLYGYADSEGAIEDFIRAESRNHAKFKILCKYPTATFFR
jgi:hypothetical protein